MFDLTENFRRVHEQIAQACSKAGRKTEDVRLITVTKTYPSEVLQSVINTGHRDIGENRVQEIVQKVPILSGEKAIHMIGHLQTNKAAKVVPLVEWIHSIDSERLFYKVEQQCEKINKKLNVLVQVNTSGEDTKSGCRPEYTLKLCEIVAKSNILDFRGLMTIGLLGGNEKETRRCFMQLREIGEKCSSLTDNNLELSMGMSNDFQIAIEEGATMIRIGSLILGARKY